MIVTVAGLLGLIAIGQAILIRRSGKREQALHQEVKELQDLLYEYMRAATPARHRAISAGR